MVGPCNRDEGIAYGLFTAGCTICEMMFLWHVTFTLRSGLFNGASEGKFKGVRVTTSGGLPKCLFYCASGKEIVPQFPSVVVGKSITGTKLFPTLFGRRAPAKHRFCQDFQFQCCRALHVAQLRLKTIRSVHVRAAQVAASISRLRSSDTRDTRRWGRTSLTSNFGALTAVDRGSWNPGLI